MIVWVLTWEPDHDNSSVTLVAASADLAKARAQESYPERALRWTEESYDGGRTVTYSSRPYDWDLAGFEITPFELCQDTPKPAVTEGETGRHRAPPDQDRP